MWIAQRTFEQMLQVHSIAAFNSGAFTLNLKAPQWQLPRYSTSCGVSDMDKEIFLTDTDLWLFYTGSGAWLSPRY
jgi:hypothetical protein